MSQTSASTMTRTETAARSTIYRLLSLAFKYPLPGIFEAYRNGEFLSELFDRMSLLPHLKGLVAEEAEVDEKFRNNIRETTFQDFEVAYTGTFDVGAPEPPCPPYEGIYRQGMERTAVMLAVSEFYKHFGLSMNTEEGKRELPDNLSAELEFLHFLTFKEGQARDEDNQELLKGYILAQRDFLERHVTKWLPAFSNRLRDSARGPLFADLGRIASKFTELEFEYVSSLLKDLDS